MIALLNPINASAQITVESVLGAVDDSTCRDGIGRTYDHETILASDDTRELARAFLDSHESCFGGPNGDLHLAISGECSPAIDIPERRAKWIICLVWFQHNLGGSRLVVDPADFYLITSANQSFRASADPTVYEGQRDDISGGVFLIGEDGRFGLLAFPLPSEAVDDTPMLLFWDKTGDILIVEVREPVIGDKFLSKDW